VGRFPEVRPSLQISVLALQRWRAAPRVLISPEVVPFRPHRGVVVIVEQPCGPDVDQWHHWLDTEHFPELLAASGVAGAWMFGSTTTWNTPARWAAEQQYVTVVYLDEDPLATTAALVPLIEQRWASGQARPLFAGPLRTMIHWDAWPAVG
jgi:hypothetical protein